MATVVALIHPWVLAVLSVAVMFWMLQLWMGHHWNVQWLALSSAITSLIGLLALIGWMPGYESLRDMALFALLLALPSVLIFYGGLHR
jgi:multisubunit Na+/H+ antiporter MnhF subunit